MTTWSISFDGRTFAWKNGAPTLNEPARELLELFSEPGGVLPIIDEGRIGRFNPRRNERSWALAARYLAELQGLETAESGPVPPPPPPL